LTRFPVEQKVYGVSDVGKGVNETVEQVGLFVNETLKENVPQKKHHLTNSKHHKQISVHCLTSQQRRSFEVSSGGSGP
jgi:hypothetical protein